MLKNDENQQNVISKKSSIANLKQDKERNNEDVKKIIISQHPKLKLTKNESFNSTFNSKSLNDKAQMKKKLLTFESVFNKNPKSTGIPIIVPQIVQSPLILPNSINFNEFSGKVPISININNYNINNYNFMKNEKGELASSFNYTKKVPSQTNVLNNFLNNNSIGSDSNNININRVYRNDHHSSNLKVLNNSNEFKPKNKYFIIDSSNSRFILNKNIKNNEFRQISKENFNVKLQSDDKRDQNTINDLHPINEGKKIFSEKPKAKKTKIKEKINIKTYNDDPNDSLIEELADFLNNENPSKNQKETNTIGIVSEKHDNFDKSHEMYIDLDNAVINTDRHLQNDIKNTRNQPQRNFLEINEKQIISSSTNNLQNNNINNINNYDDVEEGPPINYEHFQQVNSKRPQTSYGGISARQKSLQNSLRQMSSKIEDKCENEITEFNKGNFNNPFVMKNKLNQLKFNFNN